MTALRKLAERWKRNDAGDTEIVAYALNEAADELLSILDAEGDGGAVAWVADLAPGIERPNEYMGIFTPYKGYAEHLAKHADYVVTPLYTHPQPVRSGVVSDEQVNKACAIYFGSDEWFEYEDDAELVLISMRQTLEHFAKSQGESNV
jgi:hypothetical protein